MKKVLFLSTNNSARSQIAEALINHRYSSKLEAKSAGVNQVPINENTYKVMNEICIDISDHQINTPEDFKDESFDYVITLCDHARENCPVYWTKGEAVYKHIEIYDPAKIALEGVPILQAYREIRDELEEILTRFFDEELETGANDYNNLLYAGNG